MSCQPFSKRIFCSMILYIKFKKKKKKRLVFASEVHALPRRCGAPQCSSAPVLHHGGLMFILRLGLHAAAAPRLLPARLEDAAAGHLHAQLPPLNFLVVRCWWHFSIPMPILPPQCANVFCDGAGSSPSPHAGWCLKDGLPRPRTL